MEERPNSMIRSLARSLLQFVTAVILLALMLCATESAFRAQRLRTKLINAKFQQPELSVPSATTYLDVPPMLSLEQTNLAGHTLRFQTNELGCRSDGISIPKPDDVLRVLYLGGAEAFGVAVNRELTYIDQLQGGLSEHALKRLEFINAGCPKGSPLISLLRYRQRLIGLEPDLIILHLTPEDVIDPALLTSVLRTDPAGMPSFATHPAATIEPTLLDQVCDEFASVDWAVGQLAPLLGGAPTENTSAVGRPGLDSIVALARLTLADETGLLITISPTPKSLQPSFQDSASQNAESLERDIRTALEQAGLAETIQIHNSTKQFVASGEPARLFTRDGHLSEWGHRAHAESLGRYLLDHLVGVWKPTAPVSTRQSPNSRIGSVPEANPFLNQ